MIRSAEDSEDQSSTRAARASLRSAARSKDTVEDLYQLKVWRESEPEAPDGPWVKDFGSFKICGDGKYPKTFLLRGQAAKGRKL